MHTQSLIHRLTLYVGLSLLISSTVLPAQTLEVEIQGLDNPLLNNVQTLLSIQQLKGQPINNPGRIEYLHGKAEAEIRQALEPFGYYRPQIITQLTEQESGWFALYQVDPADKITIHHSHITLIGSGRNDPKLTKPLENTGLEIGQPLNHPNYQSLKASLLSIASENGYYDGRWQSAQISIDLERYQAQVELVFDTGAHYQFGQIRLAQTPINDELLLRYPEFAPGQPLQTRKLLELQASLNDSDYFSRVEVRPLWQQAEGLQVPIAVDLEPNKRTQYRIGAGFGTDTGPRGTLGFNRRWLNPQGHRFVSQLLVSSKRSDFTNDYIIPGRRPQTDQYSLTLDVKNEHSKTVDSNTVSFGASRQNKLSQRWRQTMGINWEREEFGFAPNRNRVENLIPHIGWSRLHTENPLDVERGYRASLTLQGASRALLSETNFAQILVSTKAVWSLNTNIRLLSRADFGATQVKDFSKLPSSHRFFAGGDHSIRGYDYRTLGPRDASGRVVGGTGLIVISGELDYRILPNWRLATFTDHGNAVNSASTPLKTGIGIGLRWQSPFGPVRLEVAQARDLPERPWRIHFTLGPDL